MKLKYLAFGTLAAILLVVVDAHPQTLENMRSIGMGGACTAVVEDESVLIYNPAGLAFIEGGGISVPIIIKSDKKFLDFASDEDVRGGKFSTRLSKYSPLLLDGYSGIAVYGKGFGIGTFGTGNGKFILEGEEVGLDAGIFGEGSGRGQLVLGLGLQLINEVLSLGASLKAKGSGGSYAFKPYGELRKLGDVTKMVMENSQIGYGYDIDAGAMLKIGPIYLGASAQDLLERSIKIKDDVGNVMKVIPFSRVVNVGVALKSPNIPGLSALVRDLILAGDIHNVLGEESERTLALGADARILNISDFLHLTARGGFSQTGGSKGHKRYIVGLGLKFLIFRLEAAFETSKDLLVELPEFKLSSLEKTINSYYIGISLSP